MPDSRRIGPRGREKRVARIIALALAGLLAFNYPLLSLFDAPSQWLGIPTLYLYLFVVWGLFIGLVARVLKKSGDRSERGSTERSD